MDRAEATGFGLAFAGHGALLAALALGFAAVKVPQVQSDPIEVAFVDEVGLESMAPVPSSEMPAPKLAEIEGPPEPAAAPVPEPLPAPPQLQPQPRASTPQPAQRPQPQPKASPKAAAAQPKAKATRPTGRLSGLLEGIGDTPSKSKATTPPASKAGAQVQASLGAEVRRQLKPHWTSPTGADAEQLRTELSIWLARSGAVTRIEVLRTTGITASNRAQVERHQELAKRAARLASPFRLPSEYYEEWKLLTPIGFDKRLSQ